MSKNKLPPMCVICGIPDYGCNLVRMTFVDDGRGRLLGTERMLSIAVAKAPKKNDRLVCEDCIRGIKRIPFSDFLEQPPAPSGPSGDVPPYDEIPF